jgi:RNA-binding protein
VRVFSDDRAPAKPCLQTLADESTPPPSSTSASCWCCGAPCPRKKNPSTKTACPGPRDVKVLKYSKKGGQRPEVKTVRVLGNQRLTPGGLIKRAKKPTQKSVKKSTQK